MSSTAKKKITAKKCFTRDREIKSPWNTETFPGKAKCQIFPMQKSNTQCSSKIKFLKSVVDVVIYRRCILSESKILSHYLQNVSTEWKLHQNVSTKDQCNCGTFFPFKVLFETTSKTIWMCTSWKCSMQRVGNEKKSELARNH